MSSIMEMIQKQLDGGSLDALSSQLGADKSQTGAAISAALPTLLGGLARNASQPEGAEALLGALGRDHSGNGLDNLAGFLGGSNQGDGEKILGHIFGSKQDRVERGLGQSAGFDSGSMKKLLATLAPIVLSALAKTKQERNLDASGLAGVLNQEREQVEKMAPSEMSMIGQLLDSDGDGDVDIQDIAKKGLGALGGLFGK